MAVSGEPSAARTEPDSGKIVQLIRTYIDPNSVKIGRENARLQEYGVSVAAIVTALLYAGGDLYAVAHEYEVPDDAVRAAVYYYSLNKQVLDARMLLNEAAFEEDGSLLDPDM
jgi:hypothetical protein